MPTSGSSQVGPLEPRPTTSVNSEDTSPLPQRTGNVQVALNRLEQNLPPSSSRVAVLPVLPGSSSPLHQISPSTTISQTDTDQDLSTPTRSSPTFHQVGSLQTNNIPDSGPFSATIDQILNKIQLALKLRGQKKASSNTQARLLLTEITDSSTLWHTKQSGPTSQCYQRRADCTQSGTFCLRREIHDSSCTLSWLNPTSWCPSQQIQKT